MYLHVYINCVGIVGLNNIKANDYMNVILHALTHAGPLRDYFLREENYNTIIPPPGDQTFTLGSQNYVAIIIVVYLNKSTCTCS